MSSSDNIEPYYLEFKDNRGRELDKGFYLISVTSLLVDFNNVTVFPPIWTIYDGIIDTADATGTFTSPDIPTNKNITMEIIDDQGNRTSMIGHYNGWVEFEYNKEGYVSRKDTVFVDKKLLTLNVVLAKE